MSVSATEVSKLFAKVLGRGPGRRTLAAQEQELDLLVDRLRPRRFVLGAKLAIAAAACAFAAIAFWGYTGHHFGLSAPYLSARFDGAALDVQDEIKTNAGKARPLQFSDGSEVLLEANTQAVLSYLTARRADLTLKHGALRASIEKRTGATWTIKAGPYRVRVVGTKFHVNWNEDSRELKVKVREGLVRVSGGDLPSAGVSLDAGSELSRKYQPKALAMKADGAAARSAAAMPSDRDRSIDSAERARPSARAKDPQDWEALSNQGKYGEALRAAKNIGFSRLLEELPANPLLKLANTARYAADPASAKRALTRLRERFSGSSAARLAPVYMARLAEDADHNPSEAARWLRVYLRESPSGSLAGDARVNLLSILLNLGDTEGARAVARDYLKSNPNGPHADKARSLVSQSPDSSR